MRNHRLGKSDLFVSRLGLGGRVRKNDAGAWILKNDFLALLDTCTSELGITYIDTAESYNLAEKTIGEWLTGRKSSFRDKLVIGSKVLPLYDKFGNIRQGLSRDFIRKQIDQSLRNLKIECLDLYWMHRPDPTTNLVETMRGLNDAVRAGKTRYIGISNVTTQQIENILSVCRSHGFAKPIAVQNELNLLNWPYQQRVMEICKKRGLGFMAYSPLAAGFLTGKYKPTGKLPAGSLWSQLLKNGRRPAFWSKTNFEAVDKLARDAARRKLSPTTLALAWNFSRKDVDVSLIGPRRPEHLAAVRKALQTKLHLADQKKVQDIFWETT